MAGAGGGERAGDGQRGGGRWVGVLGLVVLMLTAIAAVYGIAPTSPVSADAPVSDFSAGRGMAHINVIADAPRPLGSAKHGQTRAYLIDTLESWGWDTEVHRAVGILGAGVVGTQRIAAVANVIATTPGTASTGTVLLAAHYDTVAGAPGAADDGLGVGTLLETARALSAAGAEPPQNDVMLVFTDGEEYGLLGAEAFVRERADMLGTTVVLNHEARGANGAPITFRTSSPNRTLLEALSGAPGALAESSGEAAFEALPNDSDFTRFADAGFHGYDTAITAGSAFYHSPLDDPEHLSPASLQQMGETTLALTRDLAGRDLSTIDDSGEDLVTTLPWGLLRYPATLELPLAVATLVLTGIVVGLRRSRRALTLPRTALSAVLAVVVLVAAGYAAYALWQAVLVVDPAQASVVVGEPYRPGPYQTAVVLAALGVVLVLIAILRRWLGVDALAVGALVAFALSGVLLALALPGISGVFVLPTLTASLGAIVAGVLPGRWTVVRVVAVTIALVPAAVLLGPGVTSGFDVGLAMGAPLTAFFVAVFALLVLPVLDAAWPSGHGTRRRALMRTVAVPAGVLSLAVVAAAAGLFVNREGATPPRQEEVAYSLDADTSEAVWASPTPPRTDWSRSLLAEAPARLDDAFPWARTALAHGPAPAADLAAPEVEVLRDVDRGGVRDVTLRLSSRRGAPALGLWVDASSATVRRAAIAGRDIPANGTRGKWNFGFVFEAAPRTGVEVRLLVEQHTGDLAVRVADRSHDLREVPRFAPPPEGRVLVTPQVAVTRALTL